MESIPAKSSECIDNAKAKRKKMYAMAVALVILAPSAAIVSTWVQKISWDDRLSQIVWIAYYIIVICFLLAMSQLTSSRAAVAVIITIFVLLLAGRTLIVMGNWPHTIGMTAAKRGDTNTAKDAFGVQRQREQKAGFAVAQNLRLTADGIIQLNLESRRLSALGYSLALNGDYVSAGDAYALALEAAREENQSPESIAALCKLADQYSELSGK